MLTFPVLGSLALAVLWTTTLLVTWATLRELAALRTRAPAALWQARLLFAALFAIPGLAAACTALSLQSPVFGPTSTLGGAAGLAYFLLVQPLGTALRDVARRSPA